MIQSLGTHGDWHVAVLHKEERFVRLALNQPNLQLKIELINDVPAHVGQIRTDPLLGRLDSPENILANKITALIDREEPKDLVDIWGFCSQMGLAFSDALKGAQSKAAGSLPADLARVLYSVNRAGWELVRWIKAPEFDQYQRDLQGLAESLLLA